ncbi:MAG: hypothetical protein ACP5NZ_03020 [Nanobdellota archaeon]
MSKVTDSIGLKFERFIEERFPELISTCGNKDGPDFYHPTLNFWVEAKVGNILWGQRIKEEQVHKLDDFKEPIIYALGFHNFHDANKRLIQETEWGRQRFLDKNLKVLNTYFISSDLIKKIWEKESRISQKEGITYCMVKRGIIRNLIMNRSFERDKKTVKSAEIFYGYNNENFMIRDNLNKEDVKYGLILNKEHSQIINYIKEKLEQ